MCLLCLAHTQVPDKCLPVVIICTLCQLSSKLRESARVTPCNQPCLLQSTLLAQQAFMDIECQTTSRKLCTKVASGWRQSISGDLIGTCPAVCHPAAISAPAMSPQLVYQCSGMWSRQVVLCRGGPGGARRLHASSERLRRPPRWWNS